MEIVLRSVVLYAFLWCLIRVLGKRELGKLTAFELVVLVVLGDLIQQGVTQEDFSVTGAILAIGTFALLSMLLAYLSWRWPRSRSALDGMPTVVVANGRVIDESLRNERIPVDELLKAARLQGIRDLAHVDLAVLESNGSYSFFQRKEADG